MTKIVIAAGFAASLLVSAVQPSATLFENDEIKVVRALERPHVKGSFHEHKVNRVMVYLEGGKQRFEYKDGRKTTDFDWKAGQVEWSEPDGIHSPEVVTDEPFNIVEMELKKPGGAAITKDALTVDPRHCTLEFEKPQVRVLRVKLGAHEATPVIERTHGTVVVFLSDGDSHKTGDAIWETPGSGKIENTGSTPLELVLVELKN
ncbi:MAG TPA: hypothetical protein VN519_00215 [Bryobacteraceae bacterium]|nr:hypothetical protein [Bryobacteraceae bacterium]